MDFGDSCFSHRLHAHEFGVTSSEPQPPQYKLDFAYVSECKDKSELKRIVKRLRAEPYYPDLTRAAEARLQEIDPASKLLTTGKPATRQEQDAAFGDLESWLTSVGEKDTRIAQRVTKSGAFTPSVPPVRGTTEFKAFKERTRKKKTRPGSTSSVPNKRKGSSSKDIWASDEVPSQGAAPSTQARSQEELESMAAQYRVRGNEEFRRKRYADALEWYGRSIAAIPTEAALTNSALMNLKLNRNDEAEKNCTRALSLNSMSAKAYLRRGQARHGLEQYDGAIADYEKALKLVEPKVRSKVEQHLASCEAAKAKRDRDAAERRRIAGEAAQKRGPAKRMTIVEDDDGESSDDEEQEQKQSVSSARPQQTRRIQIVEDDDDDDSDETDNDEDAEQKTERKQPSHSAPPVAEPPAAGGPSSGWPAAIKGRMGEVEAMRQAGKAQYKEGQFDDAIQTFAKAATVLQSCLSEPAVAADSTLRDRVATLLGSVHGNRAHCAQQAQNESLVIEAATQALATAPASAPGRWKWLLKRAQANQALERSQEALEDMIQVKQMGSTGGLAKASAAVPRLRDAARAENPSRIAGSKRRGNVLFKKGQFGAAIREYSVGLRLATSRVTPFRDRITTAALFTNVALCELKLGQFDKAQESCTKALEMDPESVTALRRRALARDALPGQDGTDDRKAAIGKIEDALGAGGLSKKETTKLKSSLQALRAAIAPAKPSGDGKKQQWTKVKVVDITPPSRDSSSATATAKGGKDGTDKKRPKKAQLVTLPEPTQQDLRSCIQPPKTTIEAINTLRSIGHDLKLTSEWIRLVKPAQFESLFREDGVLPGEYLAAMLKALSRNIVAADPAFTLQVLRFLSRSGRFDLNVSMVDEDTESAIGSMFDALEANSRKSGGVDAMDVQALKDVYI